MLTALSVRGVFLVAIVVEAIPVRVVADEVLEDVFSLVFSDASVERVSLVILRFTKETEIMNIPQAPVAAAHASSEIATINKIKNTPRRIKKILLCIQTGSRCS